MTEGHIRVAIILYAPCMFHSPQKWGQSMVSV